MSTTVNVNEQKVTIYVVEDNITIEAGSAGPQGSAGIGVPTGGTNNQLLAKDGATPYATKWVDAGAGSGTVTSITATAPLTGGTITSSGSIGIDQTALAVNASQVTAGTLPVARGGTGVADSTGTLKTVLSNSPTLTGTPTTPTATVDTNNFQIASTAFVVGQAGDATPLINGAATVPAGTSKRYARQDHKHPTDTTRFSTTGGTIAGTVTVDIGTGFRVELNPGTGTVLADAIDATTIRADNGNVFADEGTSPTVTGGGNVAATNQISTTSIASDSIKTAGGVTASGRLTGANATVTSFGTAGIVHNDASGVLSSSLITTADVSSIDLSKITNAPQAPLYYQLTTSFSPSAGSPGTTLFSPFNLGGSSGSGLTVTANTTYAVDMVVQMVGTGTNRTLSVSLANSTATVDRLIANVITLTNATQITPAVLQTATYQGSYNLTSAGSIQVEPTRSTTTTVYREITIRGFIRIGASGGKLLPGLIYGTSGETGVTVYGGSYITLTPLSGTSSNGTWT